MTTKKEDFIRCNGCGLYTNICICPHIKKMYSPVRLTLLIHVKEINRLTNTGRLANLCLSNSAVFIRGAKGISWKESDILPDGYEHRILFPFANEELSENMLEINGKPLNLIVPDGTWSQAKKIIVSEPYLQNVKRIKLPSPEKSECYLRKTDNPDHIATLEAIAQAYRTIERPEIHETLEEVFYAMTAGLIRLRGYS